MQKKTKFIKILLQLVIIAGATSGCAGIAMKARFDAIGEIGSKANRPPDVASPSNVRLFYGSSPDGFTLEKNVLTIKKGYKHKVLGLVKIIQDPNGGILCDVGELPNAIETHGRKPLFDLLRQRAYQAGANALIYVQSKLPDDATKNDLCGIAISPLAINNHTQHFWASGWAVRIAPVSGKVETEPQLNPKSKPPTETKSKLKTETEPKPKTETEPKPTTETEPKPKTETEPKPKTETKPNPKTETEPKPKAEQK